MPIILLHDLLEKKSFYCITLLFLIATLGPTAAVQSESPLLILLSTTKVHQKKKVYKLNLIKKKHNLTIRRYTFSTKEIYESLAHAFKENQTKEADIKLKDIKNQKEISWRVTKSAYLDDMYLLTFEEKDENNDTKTGNKIRIVALQYSKVSPSLGVVDPYFGIYPYQKSREKKILFMAQKTASLLHHLEGKNDYEFSLAATPQPQTLFFDFSKGNLSAKMVEKTYYDPKTPLSSMDRDIVPLCNASNNKLEKSNLKDQPPSTYDKNYYDFFLIEKESKKKKNRLIKLTKLDDQQACYYDDSYCKGCTLIKLANEAMKLTSKKRKKDHICTIKFICPSKEIPEKMVEIMIKGKDIKECKFRGFDNAYRIRLHIKSVDKRHISTLSADVRDILVFPKTLLASPAYDARFPIGYTAQDQAKFLTFYYVSELLDKIKKIRKKPKKVREFYFQKNDHTIMSVAVRLGPRKAKEVTLHQYTKDQNQKFREIWSESIGNFFTGTQSNQSYSSQKDSIISSDRENSQDDNTHRDSIIPSGREKNQDDNSQRNSTPSEEEKSQQQSVTETNNDVSEEEQNETYISSNNGKEVYNADIENNNEQNVNNNMGQINEQSDSSDMNNSSFSNSYHDYTSDRVINNLKSPSPLQDVPPFTPSNSYSLEKTNLNNQPSLQITDQKKNAENAQISPPFQDSIQKNSLASEKDSGPSSRSGKTSEPTQNKNTKILVGALATTSLLGSALALNFFHSKQKNQESNKSRNA